MLRSLCRLQAHKSIRGGGGNTGSHFLTTEEAILGDRSLGKGSKPPQRKRHGGGDSGRAPFKYGVRSSGRPSLAPAAMRQRAQEDRELYKVIQEHHESIDMLGDRDGGPLLSLVAEQKQGSSAATLDVQPGDYVEKRGVDPHSAEIGVVLPRSPTWKTSAAVKDVVVVNSTGVLEVWRSPDIIISFPRFIEEDMTKAARPRLAAHKSSADSSSPRVMQLSENADMTELFDHEAFRARAAICAKMRVLMSRAEQQQQRMSPHFGHHLFSHIAESATQGVEMTAMGLAKALLMQAGVQELDAQRQSSMPASILAAHRLMLANVDIFAADEYSHRLTNTFTIRPPKERQAIQNVREWIQNWVDGREANGTGKHVMQNFCAKVKRAMMLREAAGPVNENFGSQPEAAQENAPPVDWSKEERDILTFLRISISARRHVDRHDFLGSYAVQILKGCDLIARKPITLCEAESKGDESDVPAARRYEECVNLLTALGFITPWEDVGNFFLDRDLIDEIRQYEQKVHNISIQTDDNIRMSHDLPVYVIDDATARELDDGISVEQTPDDDVIWVHALIADPTVAVQPDDKLAELAKRQHENVYFQTQQHDMLPASFARLYGLHRNDGDGDTNMALRFSAKIKLSTGAALEYDVNLARLSDIHVVSYDDVDSVLRDDATAKVTSEAFRKDLASIARVARVLAHRRQSVGGALNFAQVSHPVSVSPSALPSSAIWDLPDVKPANPLFKGFPRITLSGPQRATSEEDSRFMVSEVMILANRIAGAWLASRNLPGYYRGQAGPTDDELAKLQDLIDKEGELSSEVLLEADVSLLPSTLTHQPSEHYSLGINTNRSLAVVAERGETDVLLRGGYVRATSPLRRFSDLAMHWQIKAALRGKEPVYSTQDILRDIPRLTRMDIWASNTKRESASHWTALALRRAQLYRNLAAQGTLAPTPELDAIHASALCILDGTHDAIVTLPDVRYLSNLERAVRVRLIEHGISANCAWNKTSVVNGERLKVRVLPLDPQATGRTIHVEPV